MRFQTTAHFRHFSADINYTILSLVLPKHQRCHASVFFSSSTKETCQCTLRRNRVRVSRRVVLLVVLEPIQVLKYSYQLESLSFVEDLSIAKEADCTICGQLTESAQAVDELTGMAAGKYGELEELIKNKYVSSNLSSRSL